MACRDAAQIVRPVDYVPHFTILLCCRQRYSRAAVDNILGAACLMTRTSCFFIDRYSYVLLLTVYGYGNEEVPKKLPQYIAACDNLFFLENSG